jgi:hypothetical protein
MKFERSPFGTDRVRAIDSQIDNHLVNLGSVGGHGGQMIRKVTPKRCQLNRSMQHHLL